MGAGNLTRDLLLLALLLAGWCVSGPAASEPLRLGPSTSHDALAPHAAYYHDETGTDDLAAVSAKLTQGRFEPLVDGKTSFGFRTGAFWFHAEVVNGGSAQEQWLLVQEYALGDRIDVNAIGSDGTLQHWSGGDHQPFSQRSIRHRHPNFLLSLPQGEPVTLLVRVQSESSMQVPLVLYTPTAFAEHATNGHSPSASTTESCWRCSFTTWCFG